MKKLLTGLVITLAPPEDIISDPYDPYDPCDPSCDPSCDMGDTYDHDEDDN